MNIAHYQKAVEENRVIYLTGTINQELLFSFRRQMKEAIKDHSGDEYVIVLSTPGGNTVFGAALHNEIKAFSQGRTVWIAAQSLIQSAGIHVLLAVPNEYRMSFPMTEFYCHTGKLTWGIELKGSLEEHKYHLKEYRAAVDSFEKESERLFEVMRKNIQANPSELEDLIKNPRAIYEDEAKTLGLISLLL